jgi:hypothetical protein
MCRDAIGACLHRKMGGAERIGMTAPARVADGGHVVDVHTQT